MPQWEKSVDRKLVEVLEKNWRFLTTGIENRNFQRMRFELVAERNFTEEKKELYTEKLLEAATKRISGANISNTDDSEEKYRKMEYDAILAETGGENQDFFVTKDQANTYDDTETGGAISNGFTSIGLLHKLRETRTFVGFQDGFPMMEKV